MVDIKFFILMVFVLTSLSSAATLSVNGTGANCLVGTQTNYSTIQAAVNAASAGDTIRVCRNSTVGYNETLIVNKSLNIYGNESFVLVRAASVSSPVFAVNATYVNITNLSITGATSSMGIRLNSTSGNAHIWEVNSSGNNYGFYLDSSSNNNLTNNTANGSSNYGISVSTGSSNNTVAFNTIHNSSGSGIQVSQNQNNTFISNSVYNMTTYSMFVSLSHNSTFTNNTFNNSWYGPILQSSDENVLVGNTMAGNSIDGLQIQGSDSNNISSNTIFGNFQTGINVISGSQNNRIFSNSIYNHTNGTATGIIFTSINVVNHVYNNSIITNNTYGIYLNRTNFTNITNNTAYNNSVNGFYFSAGSNNTITSNTAYNNSQNGFRLESSSDNNAILSNTASNNTLDGFSLNPASSNNMSDNIANGNFRLGYLLIGNNNTINNNTAKNNAQAGFVIQASTGNNLSLNNATNNSVQYQLSSNANVTFTGINYALSTPSNGLDLNITGGSNGTTLVGSTYNNFTTSYGTIFFDNAKNVTIKLMNLSDSGASSTGCSGFTGTCTLLTLSNNLANISNASATGTIILGMYYDTSTSPTSSNLYIGKYNTTNSGWQQIGQTSVDTANGTVRYGAITSFSTFGVVNFVAPSSTTSSSDGTTVKSLEIDYDFTCSDGSLEVSTTKGAEVSLVELSPIYLLLEKKEADSEGNALFTITEDGTYKIRATKSGYTSAEEENLEFNLCGEETPEEDGEEPEPEPQPEQPPEQLECSVDSDCEEGYECKENSCALKTVAPPLDNPQSEALDSINKIQQQLNKAKSEGKDITEAQKKLDEAKEAYENGEYEKAKQLVSRVQGLVKTPESKQPEQPKEPAPKEQGALGPLLIIGSAVVVVVVLVGAYLFLKGGKSEGYKFKK